MLETVKGCVKCHWVLTGSSNRLSVTPHPAAGIWWGGVSSQRPNEHNYLLKAFIPHLTSDLTSGHQALLPG